MAINIFSGGAGKSNRGTANAASASTRAQQAKAALAKPGETSATGSTAVGTQSTLSKVGNFVGNVANVASKFLPGIGGTIAKGIAGIFNDPEWWQNVPGDGVTLNEPLRQIGIGHFVNVNTDEVPDKPYLLRSSILEMNSFLEESEDNISVMKPTDVEITQYLMPQIRKVVNAIPLQAADKYAKVLSVNASVYALWRTLLKYKYLTEHGQTYLASFNDVAFPILQVENAAFLSSSINRLEEYLRSNVRLPHTLCEYLAWRFGRVYKSNDSAKAALVMYDAMNLSWQIPKITNVINNLLSATSQDDSLQKASADMYNAYYDHDLLVEIRDDTQFKYDKKEFCLRTNADFIGGYSRCYKRGNVAVVDRSNGKISTDLNPIIVDSDLDNPTVFMASSVSTLGKQYGNESILFPITDPTAFIPAVNCRNSGANQNMLAFDSDTLYGAECWYAPNDSTLWAAISLRPFICDLKIGDASITNQGLLNQFLATSFTKVMVARQLDLYNCQQYLLYKRSLTLTQYETCLVDASSISIDTGTVSDTVLGNEHIFAFANLTCIDRKHSMSYNQAEKLVARDTANLIEKLDVATKA